MKQRFPLISVVVPMHNSAEYISRCILSIIDQDFDKFELLLIDDHSVDETIQVCRKLATDTRIRIINNNGNRGASATRNVGIKEARGEYISFIDSDDIVAKNYLSALYKMANRYPSSLAMCGYIEFSDDFSSPFNLDSEIKTLIVPSDVMISNIFHYHSSACACLFRRDLVNKYVMVMEENASFNEDVYFTCKYLSICEGAVISTERLYGYFENPNGIGAHKAHSDLTIKDVNHRAEGYIALQDAISFTDKFAPKMSKYVRIGYTFIAAEVKLTAARARVKEFDHRKEIGHFLTINNRIKFIRHGKSLKQVLLVNGIAISPRLIRFLLDDLKLLRIVK